MKPPTPPLSSPPGQKQMGYNLHICGIKCARIVVDVMIRHGFDASWSTRARRAMGHSSTGMRAYNTSAERGAGKRGGGRLQGQCEVV